jgi:hypothetical protein
VSCNAIWLTVQNCALSRIALHSGLMIMRDFISQVPVAERRGRLYALGVPLMLDPPCRISDSHYWKIDEALSAKAAAEGVNMPVALTPGVWLIRCRRCNAPFIGLPSTKICSDECRAESRRDSVRKALVKRTQRRAEASNARTSACRHCGERLPARRSTKRFCSVGCRVAAHRGVPPTFVVEWADIGETPETAWVAWTASETVALDRKIADMQSVLAGLALVGTNDLAFMQRLAERVMGTEPSS